MQGARLALLLPVHMGEEEERRVSAIEGTGCAFKVKAGAGEAPRVKAVSL